MPSAGKQLQTSILNPARGGRAAVRVSIVGLHAWEGAPYETSPPSISASGRGRCRAPGGVADRTGASLSVAAGAHCRRLRSRRAERLNARLIGHWLSERLGQQFIIDNRPGASGNIAMESVVRSPPDGYTLVTVATSSAVNATLFKNLPFNFLRDIAPVGSIGRTALVMEVHPSVPVATGLELIAYAKANPNKLNMASPGSGTGPHMASELFKLMTGVSMIHVPYRS
jgi:hypothetical protein